MCKIEKVGFFCKIDKNFTSIDADTLWGVLIVPVHYVHSMIILSNLCVSIYIYIYMTDSSVLLFSQTVSLFVHETPCKCHELIVRWMKFETFEFITRPLSPLNLPFDCPRKNYSNTHYLLASYKATQLIYSKLIVTPTSLPLSPLLPFFIHLTICDWKRTKGEKRCLLERSRRDNNHKE